MNIGRRDAVFVLHHPLMKTMAAAPYWDVPTRRSYHSTVPIDDGLFEARSPMTGEMV